MATGPCLCVAMSVGVKFSSRGSVTDGASDQHPSTGCLSCTFKYFSLNKERMQEEREITEPTHTGSESHILFRHFNISMYACTYTLFVFAAVNES